MLNCQVFNYHKPFVSRGYEKLHVVGSCLTSVTRQIQRSEAGSKKPPCVSHSHICLHPPRSLHLAWALENASVYPVMPRRTQPCISATLHPQTSTTHSVHLPTHPFPNKATFDTKSAQPILHCVLEHTPSPACV